MEIRNFLQNHSLEELSEKYAIACNRHNEYPNLIGLKYSQLNSPMKEPIVRECRGIILDEEDDWKIISYPFNKFFNFNEFYASKIDLKSSRIYEKVDGSIMTLYFYKSQWHVASAGLPDAGGKVRNQPFTISELFWKIWNESGYMLPENRDYCYIFEMTSPFNQVIVPHENCGLTLIGARNTITFQEEQPESFADTGWSIVKSFNFDSIDDLLEECKRINPMVQEGFVICDENFNRVKVKSPQYVNIGFLRGTDDKDVNKHLLEIVRTNEESEFLAYKPEYTELYNKVKKKYNDLLGELEEHYEKVKHIEDNREFGLACKDTKIPSLFFNLKNKKVTSVSEYLYGMKSKNLLKILKL